MPTNDSVEDYRTKADEQFSRLARNLDSPLDSAVPRPWRPKVAGRIALFLGPIAGALIVAMSLRRMGRRESARKVALLGLALTAAEAAILFFIPDVFSRLVGFAAEIAFRLIFPPLMQKEFTEWEGNHAGVRPANGWKAVGWGLIGVVLFFVILLSVFTGLLAVLPGR